MARGPRRPGTRAPPAHQTWTSRRGRGIRHLPSCCQSRVIDLSQTYRHLGRPWTHEELAVRYLAADARGLLLGEAADAIPERPIALLATAIPSTATLSVAMHLLHALPDSVQDKLRGELLDTAETNAADALHRCHRALELDGDAHGYTADEWLPVIYDIAGPLLESSRLDQEPPSVVRRDPGGGALALKLDRLPRRGLSRDPGGPRRHARSPAGRVRVRRLRPLALRVAGPAPRRCLCGAYPRAAGAVVGPSPMPVANTGSVACVPRALPSCSQASSRTRTRGCVCPIPPAPTPAAALLLRCLQDRGGLLAASADFGRGALAGIECAFRTLEESGRLARDARRTSEAGVAGADRSSGRASVASPVARLPLRRASLSSRWFIELWLRVRRARASWLASRGACGAAFGRG